MTSSNQRQDMRATLRQAAKHGRHGDTDIVHVNSMEKAVLRGLMQGAGTTNPETGLEEFYNVADSKGAGAREGYGADSGGRIGAGGNGQGGRGGGNYRGISDAVAEGDSRAANVASLDALGQGATQSDWSGAVDAGRSRVQGQGGRGGTSFGNSTTADYQMARQYGVTPDRYNQEAADYRDRIADANNTDNSFGEDLGNLFAGFMGFNEQNPDQIDFDPQNPAGPRASWGFDPAGAIGGAVGTAFGVPLVGGWLADQASAALGRPLAVSLGPDVFDTESTVDPITGEKTAGGKTFTGPSVTVRDDDNPGTFYGLPREFGGFIQGVANVSPQKHTFTGVDPAVADQPAPAAPTAEVPTGVGSPEPITADNVHVDSGNSGLTDRQLTDLFTGFMAPKTYRGRNRTTVVV